MIKKIIALILTVSVLLSMAVVNVNAEEVSAERVTNFENAVTLLKKLGAISNETYTFDSEITKAQFVDLMSKIIPVGDGAEAPLFSDVPATHANFKVIQGFADAGYINGYAGSFEPDRAITYNEALYIMLNTMGYGDFLGLVAKYPAGGWDFARRLDIKMNNKGAVAGDIFYMVYQALKANMFTIDGIDKGNLKFSNEDRKTLLEEYCDVEYTNGILKTNGRVSIDSQYVADPEMIVIDNDKYDISEECAVLPGCEVDVFYTMDTDDVVCVVATAKNEIVTIKSEDIKKYDNLKYTYKEDGRSKTLKITIGTDIVMNNVLATDGYENDAMVPVNGNIIAINGGTGSDYDVLYVNAYDSFVVSAISKDEDIVTISWETENDDDIHVDIDSAAFNIENAPLMRDAEGNVITFDDIQVNDVISVLRVDSVITEIVKSDAIITGDLTKIYEDDPSYVIVDGQTYNIAASAEFIITKLVPQSGITLYADFMGNIVGFNAAASNGLAYGYILDAKVSRNEEYEDCIKVEIFSEIGSIIEYCLCPDKIRIDGKSWVGGKDYDPQPLFDEKFKDDKGKVINQLIRYDVNEDREINNIDFPVEITGDEITSTADNRLFEKYRISDADAYAMNLSNKKVLGTKGNIHYNTDTLIFKIPADELLADALPEDYQVIREIGKLKNNGRYNIRKVYTLGEDSMYANVLIVSDCTKMYPTNPEDVIVKDVKKMIDEYDEPYYELTVIGVSGEKVLKTKTARVAEEPHINLKPGTAPESGFRKLVPGDVIRYLLDTDGTYVIDITFIYDVQTGEVLKSRTADEEYGSVSKGYVYTMDDKYIGLTTTSFEELQKTGTKTDNLRFEQYETYKIDDFKIFKMEIIEGKKAEEITTASKKDLKSYKANGSAYSNVLYVGARGTGKMMIILD